MDHRGGSNSDDCLDHLYIKSAADIDQQLRSKVILIQPTSLLCWLMCFSFPGLQYPAGSGNCSNVHLF